jgi:hypothetical protein
MSSLTGPTAHRGQESNVASTWVASRVFPLARDRAEPVAIDEGLFVYAVQRVGLPRVLPVMHGSSVSPTLAFKRNAAGFHVWLFYSTSYYVVITFVHHRTVILCRPYFVEQR